DALPAARAPRPAAQRPRPHLGRLHRLQDGVGCAAPAARAVRAPRRQPDRDPVAPDAGPSLRVPVLRGPRGAPRRPGRRQGARGGRGPRPLAPRARLLPARRRGRRARMSIASRVKPSVASLEPYVPGKPVETLERELGISGAIKLASNENPPGP